MQKTTRSVSPLRLFSSCFWLTTFTALNYLLICIEAAEIQPKLKVVLAAELANNSPLTHSLPSPVKSSQVSSCFFPPVCRYVEQIAWSEFPGQKAKLRGRKSMQRQGSIGGRRLTYRSICLLPSQPSPAPGHSKESFPDDPRGKNEPQPPTTQTGILGRTSGLGLGLGLDKDRE